MKSLPVSLLFTLFASALVSADGNGEPAQPPWPVRIDVQIVALPASEAPRLIPRIRDPGQCDAAFAEIQQMIARDAADLLDWPAIVTMIRFGQPDEFATPHSDAGNRFVTQSGLEPLFPSEFEPPQIPGVFTESLDTPPTSALVPMPRGTPGMPAAFESRECGVSLSGAAAISATGEQLTLRIEGNYGQLLGYRETAARKATPSVEGVSTVPEFSELRIDSIFHVRNGRRMLMASFVREKPAPGVVLFLLHVVATRPFAAK